jgi:hypothetical protein
LSAAQKQMYIYKIKNPKLVSNIKTAVKEIQFNKDINKSFREIDDVELVSLQEMFRLADEIDQCQLKNEKYWVTTVSDKRIRLNRLYAEVFAHSCDHTRLEYAKKMFEMILK